MCGILGKITFHGPHESEEVFDRALAHLDHRGPDDRGTFHCTTASGVRVSLGQTRLSILDLSEAGHQPMISPRTRSVIAFNGEAYNFREVREELARRGLTFTSECDTEVLLAAYDERGEAFIEPFRGMFAMGIYDRPGDRLVLVRDRLGIKPLYYYWDGRQLAFASEVTALAALPTLDLEVSQYAIRQFLLRGSIAHPLSIFEKVSKLPAGHRLACDFAAPAPRVARYWDSLDSYAHPRAFRDEGEVLEALRAELTEAVRLRLISDVPLGAFLSGGVDSSLVVALMRRVHTGRVRTFSIGFTVPEWNEAPAAKRIAEHLGTEHEEFYLTEENILEAARTAADHYDEPFADSSNIPTLELSRLTRKFVTVALSGDGGDELFWGYNSYVSRSVQGFRHVARIPRFVRKGMSRLMRLLRGTALERWGWIIDFDDFAEYYMRTSIWHPWLYPRLHRHPMQGSRVVEIGRRVAERLPVEDTPLITGAMDVQYYLVDDILTKVDRASMSVALEARVPILDHRVVELAASIPSSFKTAGGEQKHLLKALLADYLPRKLWDRPKMGFGVPLVHWLRTSLREWAYDVLGSRDGRLHDWLDRGELIAMLDDHCAGRRDMAELIWTCVQLAGWDRRIAAIRSAAPSPSMVVA
jgi:asparagine synthase (glutamine-hydrolysing)